MNSGPAPPDPDQGSGPDSSDQALAGRDEAWESWLASRERCEADEPLDFEDDEDYYDDPDELAEITAEARQASADQAVAVLSRTGSSSVMGGGRAGSLTTSSTGWRDAIASVTAQARPQAKLSSPRLTTEAGWWLRQAIEK